MRPTAPRAHESWRSSGWAGGSLHSLRQVSFGGTVRVETAFIRPKSLPSPGKSRDNFLGTFSRPNRTPAPLLPLGPSSAPETRPAAQLWFPQGAALWLQLRSNGNRSVLDPSKQPFWSTVLSKYSISYNQAPPPSLNSGNPVSLLSLTPHKKSQQCPRAPPPALSPPPGATQDKEGRSGSVTGSRCDEPPAAGAPP